MHVGDTVGDFAVEDQHGNPLTLNTLTADGPVVLYFFPKAMTPG